MIRLAVFDIDRTLVSPDVGIIAPETVAALKQLQSKGIKTAIARGRLYSFLQADILDLGFDYYVMSNGGYVADRDGNVLIQEALDDGTVAAHGRHGLPPGKVAHHGHVGGVEELLENTAHGQRQGEEQEPAQYGAFEHVDVVAVRHGNFFQK